MLRQSRTVLNILLVTFPFFALVLGGFVAAHRRMLPLEAIPGLNGFVLFFALTIICAVRGVWMLAMQWMKNRRREAIEVIGAPATLSSPSAAPAMVREA